MSSIEDIEQLAKRRGFFWTSNEIYGGLSGFFDYGHNGTLMKRKLENLWRKYFLSLGENFYEIDPTNIMHEKVFVASGHVSSFVDPVAKCKKCGTLHRADHIVEEYLHESFEGMKPEELTELIRNHKIRCTNCKGELGDVSIVNMMFPLNVGADGKAFLRPETAQGPFVNFLQEFEVSRKQIPLGLAVIGKAFRNEISPRQLTTRMREFTQAELQIFFDPEKLDDHEHWNKIREYRLILYPVSARKQDSIEVPVEDANSKFSIPKFYLWHMVKVQQFFLEKLNIPRSKFRFKELSEDERAFYNKIHWDIEIYSESLGGFKEAGGVHYRTDHDLGGHAKISKKSHEVFFDNKKFVPHILELSFGVDRMIYVLLDMAMQAQNERTILKLPPVVAPYIAAIFPLMNKEGLDDLAQDIYKTLKSEWDVFYDDGGSIGRRYARADEIGTPFCITVDFDSKKDASVTIRHRDTGKQDRVPIHDIAKYISTRIGA